MAEIKSTPLADYCGELDGDQLGDETGRAYATLYEAQDGDDIPEGKAWWWVTYNEGLAWHREVRIVDLPEELDADQLERLLTVLDGEVGRQNRPEYLDLRADMAQDILDPDGRAVEFAVKVELPEDATDTDLIEAAWSFIATCINITDPGTFGSPYVMHYAQED